MSELPADDVVSIVGFFRELDDPRSHINRLHLLSDVLVICVLAVISGADGPKAIGIWAEAHRHWLSRHLKLPNDIPSHDKIGRILAALRPETFQTCFEAWIASVSGTGLSDEANRPVEYIAIDGKSVRRSHDRRRGLGPLFLVSACSVRRGTSLGQLATEAKSNEISAIPSLLDQIEVAGAAITIDAAGC